MLGLSFRLVCLAGVSTGPLALVMLLIPCAVAGCVFHGARLNLKLLRLLRPLCRLASTKLDPFCTYMWSGASRLLLLVRDR